MDDVDLPVLPPIEPDAGQGPGDGARRPGGVVLRAEMGRLPRAGVPRRRRGGAAVAQRQGTRPVLPRAAGRAARRDRPAVRARRRGGRPARDRRPHPAGLGVAQPAHPPGREQGEDAGRADARAFHRIRCAGHRRRFVDGRAVPGAAPGVVGFGDREAVVPCHPYHRGPASWARNGSTRSRARVSTA